MRHYVAYNKVEEWGEYTPGVDAAEYGHYSRHPKAKLEKIIGQTIWVFSGERVNGRMVYKLCSTYGAEDIEENAEEVEASGFRCVVGSGLSFVPPILVNDLEWFAELFREQNRFSFGINQIRSEHVIQSLERLKESYLENRSRRTVLQDIEDLKSTYETLRETTRQSVIESRIGQGLFRSSLIQYWQGCSVTGCKNLEILKASHIKPWRDSSNEERLDVFNGLLLIPNLDTCFDLGLISFDDSGQILVSSGLDETTREQLGIYPDLRLLRVDEKHKEFLRYHRDRVFQS
ncbi:MAG: HNH endonuclease [Armatimonadota bacterium]|nr:HNH endonuclease [Armatimonadota bacterium]